MAKLTPALLWALPWLIVASYILAFPPTWVEAAGPHRHYRPRPVVLQPMPQPRPGPHRLPAHRQW